MIPLSDLDQYVSRDQAASLLGVTSIYVQQLCRAGDLDGRLQRIVTGGRGGHLRWGHIDLYSVLALAAKRHATGGPNYHRCQPPEAIQAQLAAMLPARCPECGILVDTAGLCGECQQGRPNYWVRLGQSQNVTDSVQNVLRQLSESPLT